MIERTASAHLDRVGGVKIDTDELREALRRTGEPLGLAACRASEIDEAIEQIVRATERGVEHLREHNARYGTVRHGAGLATLGGSPLRSPGDFKVAVGQLVGQRLSAAGIEVQLPDGRPNPKGMREQVDRVRGLSLLALVQAWRSGGALGSEPDAAA